MSNLDELEKEIKEKTEELNRLKYKTFYEAKTLTKKRMQKQRSLYKSSTSVNCPCPRAV